MNPTSLFTNVLSLVPRRDAEARPLSVHEEGPRFELPELPDTAAPGPARHDLSLSEGRHDREQEREDEPEPRAELVMQRGPDELAAQGFEDEQGGTSGDAPDFDANGRPRTMRGQGEADPTGKNETAGVRRELDGNPAPDAETTTSRAYSNASAQASSAQQASGQSQPGQSQSGHAQSGQPQSGQAPAASGQTQGPGQGQGQQVQASAVAQAQVTQTGQVAPLVQGGAQAMTPVAAQLLLAQQDPDPALEVPGGLDNKAPPATSEAGGANGLDALLEAGLDGLGLKLSDRVLGVGANTPLAPGATQTPADLSGEVADAVQRLLADAADQSSLLRFRTESGQTFLAQARLEPGQPMELRLLSDDPGVRAMLAERLNDLRSALGRVGFGDAEVQVDRDPSHHGGHSRQPEDREAVTAPLDELAPRTRRAAYGAPETAQSGAGRLHLIL